MDQDFTLKQMNEIVREEENQRVSVGFMNLEKAYDCMRMYDVGDKLLNIIKSIYVCTLSYLVQEQKSG